MNDLGDHVLLGRYDCLTGFETAPGGGGDVTTCLDINIGSAPDLLMVAGDLYILRAASIWHTDSNVGGIDLQFQIGGADNVLMLPKELEIPANTMVALDMNKWLGGPVVVGGGALYLYAEGYGMAAASELHMTVIVQKIYGAYSFA